MFQLYCWVKTSLEWRHHKWVAYVQVSKNVTTSSDAVTGKHIWTIYLLIHWKSDISTAHFIAPSFCIQAECRLRSRRPLLSASSHLRQMLARSPSLCYDNHMPMQLHARLCVKIYLQRCTNLIRRDMMFFDAVRNCAVRYCTTLCLSVIFCGLSVIRYCVVRYAVMSHIG